MSIAKLRKITLVGPLAEKDSVLAGLQTLGGLHLIDTSERGAGLEVSAPEGRSEGREALAFLLDASPRRRQVLRRAEFDAGEIVQKALAIKHRLEERREERDFLTGRLEALAPWGDFAYPSIEEMGGYRLWFYQIPSYAMRRIPADAPPWSIVGRDNRSYFVVVISANEPTGMPVKRTHTGAEPRHVLDARLAEVESEMEDLDVERASLSRWCTLLSEDLDALDDEAALVHAKAKTFDADPVFVITAWAPVDVVPAVRRFAEEHRLALHTAPPRRDELPPTLLQNPPGPDGGEDLVTFYMTPSYWSWDPSALVLFSFAIFFAMILADAGYAVLLAALLGVMWRKWGRSDGLRRVRRIASAVVGASVVYGVLVGSYFGMAPEEGTWLAAAIVARPNDASTMMPLSIAIGGAHLFVANLAAAFRLGWHRTALAPVGWAMATIGGLVTWATELAWVALGPLGPILLGLGLTLVLLFTSAEGSLPKNLLEGLKSVAQLSKAFGDVLSYLRLFALGLASTALAVAFNDLGAQVRTVPGLGLFLGLLVLLVGHGLNLLLAVVGGVVHGLRLNVIEFFSWGLREEGIPFRAFKRKERRVWTPSSSA